MFVVYGKQHKLFMYKNITFPFKIKNVVIVAITK